MGNKWSTGIENIDLTARFVDRSQGTAQWVPSLGTQMSYFIAKVPQGAISSDYQMVGDLYRLTLPLPSLTDVSPDWQIGVENLVQQALPQLLADSSFLHDLDACLQTNDIHMIGTSHGRYLDTAPIYCLANALSESFSFPQQNNGNPVYGKIGGRNRVPTHGFLIDKP